MPMGEKCAVHRHREAVPLEVHHVWPVGMGGPDVAGNRVQVCANGHGMAHYLLAELVKRGGVVPWTVRRRYGRKTRALALLGYQRVTARQPVMLAQVFLGTRNINERMLAEGWAAPYDGTGRTSDHVPPWPRQG